MSIIRVGYFVYDTADIVGKCPKCEGYVFNTPNLITRTEVGEEKKKEFYAGLWGFGFCPKCYKVYIWELRDRKYILL